MASPKRWNYWVEIHAGNNDWVDFSGNTLKRIVFSLLPTTFTASEIPETLVLPLDLEPDTFSEALEEFPKSFLPRVPDFSFTINLGYTSPSGFFTTRDALLGLEQVNKSYGKMFRLQGCRVLACCGDAANVGMWYNGGWRCCFGGVTSTATAPGENETMRILPLGVIANIDRNGMDTATISTTYMDEYASTGTVIPTDSENDTIKTLIYTSTTGRAKASLSSGKLYIQNTDGTISVYLAKSSTGKSYLIDPDSYSFDQSSGVIDFGSGAQYGTWYAELGKEPCRRNNFAYWPKFTINPQDEFSLFTATSTGLTTIGDSETLAVVNNYSWNGYSYIDDPISYVNGRRVDIRNIVGRDYSKDGQFKISTNTKLYKSSVLSDRDYFIYYGLTSYPQYCRCVSLVDNTDFPDGVVAGNGAVGDMTTFIDRSKSGEGHVYDWDETTCAKTPIIMISNPGAGTGYQKNLSRLKIHFDDFANIEGNIASVKVYANLRYNGYVRAGHSVNVKLYTADGEIMLANAFKFSSSGEIFDFTWAYSGPFQIDSSIWRYKASSLSDLFLDVEFDYGSDSGILGFCALWGIKIEAVVRDSITEDDKLIIEYTPNTPANPKTSVSLLLATFCPNEMASVSIGSSLPIDAAIMAQEPIRTTIADILLAGSCTMSRRQELDNTMGVWFHIVNLSERYEAAPITITDDSILSDGMPIVDVSDSQLDSVYNAFKITYGYDHVLGRYTKTFYIDGSGAIYSGISATCPDEAVISQYCAYASNIVGNTKKVLSFEGRFMTDEGAFSFAILLSSFLCLPLRTSTVSAIAGDAQDIEFLQTVKFSGSKLPYHITSLDWLLVGKDFDMKENTTTLTMIEKPDWSFL